MREFLAELTATDPALILLEDLHWADPASIDLLRHVGPHLRHWPILLLATYRARRAEPRPPALRGSSRRSSARRRGSGSTCAGSTRTPCGPSSAGVSAWSDRTRIVSSPTWSTTPRATLLRHRAAAHAGGGGALRTGRRWLGARRPRPGALCPSLLRQVIDGRVARLGEETRRPLAMAAVIGQEVPLALWAEVAALDEEALLDIVEQAVEAHLLEAERDGTRVRFVHALTREALYEGILPPRRRPGIGGGRGAAGEREPGPRCGRLPPAAGRRSTRLGVAGQGRRPRPARVCLGDCGRATSGGGRPPRRCRG